MNASKVFINKVQLNNFLVNNAPLLKIYFALSKPDLELSEGEFDYLDDQGKAIKLPLINLKDGILLTQIKENISYQGQLRLKLQTGESINQDLGFALIPWLNEFKISFSPILSTMRFKGNIALKVDPEQQNEVNHFEINSNLMGGQLSLDNTSAEAYFKNINPEVVTTLNISRYDNNGNTYQAQLPIYVPKLQLEPKSFNQPDLGYGKYIDSSNLQETYNLPTTKNILAQQSTWLTHKPETASLTNTKMLAVKSVTSTDAAQYINKHDLSQHNNYLDYSEARSQGFAAGPTTKATWNKSHQGNIFLNHAGIMNQRRQVQTENLNISAPEINYQYGTRTTNYSGNSFTHNAINTTEITNNEQSVINNFEQNAPVAQESTNQSTEQYDSQNFNFENFTSYAEQLNLSGPVFIDSDSFDISEGSEILNNLQQQQQQYNQLLNQDNDYDLFVATVYGEAADTEAAWEAVADSIVLRARHKKEKPGVVAAQRRQYDAYINPIVLKGLIAKQMMKEHGQFLKAYAYLTGQKINGKNPMTTEEQNTLDKMYAELKPIYNQYQDKSPLKYTITNYYSPGAQAKLYHYQPSFLKDIQNPDQYLVNVPNVPGIKFKFYNIPSQ